MQRPLVTTIVPAFNAERFVAEAIESALSQAYRPLEVVVVDDGSTDATAEIVAGFEGVRLIRQENRGPAAARNVAIEAAEGEVIVQLDADDTMPPDRLDLQVGYLLDHPEAAAVLGRQHLVVEPGVEMPLWLARDGNVHGSVEGAPDLGDDGHQVRLYPPNSLAAWRRTFEQVGPYDESFGFGEDLDWCLRLWDLELEIGRIEKVVLNRRIHGGNMTYDEAGVRLGAFRAIKGRIDRRRAAGSAPASE